MKKEKVLAGIAILVVVSSCTNHEIVNVENQACIDFKAYTFAPTKASEIEGGTLLDFKVAAFKTTGAWSEKADPYLYMDNASVTRDNKDSEWHYAENYYWPVSEDKLHFFAVSPNSVNDIQLNGGADYPSFSYTVEDEVALQEDVIVANKIDQTKTSAGGQVILGFKHILTQVNFSFTGAETGYTYRVNSVKVGNVYNEGTFTYNDNTTGTWDVTTGTGVDYTYPLKSLPDPLVINGTEVIDAQAANGALMLMPQNSVQQHTLQVTITYTVTDNRGDILIFNGEKKAELDGDQWALGQKIRYTVKLPLGADKITFTTNVTPWAGSEQAVDLTN